MAHHVARGLRCGRSSDKRILCRLIVYEDKSIPLAKISSPAPDGNRHSEEFRLADDLLFAFAAPPLKNGSSQLAPKVLAGVRVKVEEAATQRNPVVVGGRVRENYDWTDVPT